MTDVVEKTWNTLSNGLFEDLDLKYSSVMETIDGIDELSFSWSGGGAYLVQNGNDGNEAIFGVFNDDGSEEVFSLPSQHAVARLYLESLCN